MTVSAPATPETSTLERAPSPAAPSPLTQAHSGFVVGGTPSGDVIVLSSQALAIVRAGMLVRAFVINGLETLRRRLDIGAGRMLSLEYGIYRMA